MLVKESTSKLLDLEDRIIQCILEGKYSLACVLYLKLKGLDPRDYLPSRTISRILKENQL